MSQLDFVTVKRLFVPKDQKAYDQIEWGRRDSLIVNPMTNEVVFEQKNVEFPTDWSLNAINIVSQKYFSGTPGTSSRETSLKMLINRVVDTISEYGYENSYFDSKEELENFREELKFVLATQRAAFNSPVWFNIGVKDRTQQASACFILSVEDTMSSILNWYVEEGMIFKGGSGAGINLSPIRSSYEPLSGSGGTASGPLSFMRGADASAGAIKSGGKTRRAAKMVILNIDHPDIIDFIWSKAIEERKAHDLSKAGWDMSLNGKDIISIQYQNANISVRVTDEFMEAVENDADWELKAVTSGLVLKKVKAKDLFRQIAEASWECADPGMQFDTTINKWHTTPKAGRINSSNPCSEYMHLDNSACNLASINLLKYLSDDNTFMVEEFKHTVDLLIIAQEILVGYSSYPTPKITKNARAYRELGIGYANLGALLMAQGLPYDSDEGRAQAAVITAIMTGEGYAISSKIAHRVGPFSGFDQDKESVYKVLKMHQAALSGIDPALVKEDLLSSAVEVWDEANNLAKKFGVRNSQISLLAPTGTIGLMMDCDTTGIEPDLGLTKIKKLVGGGTMMIINQTVPRALRYLGYTKDQVKDIVEYLDREKTIINAPHLKPEHLDVFACSMGDNPIHYLGHVKMMAAVQPFLSGAISKTVNMPENVSVEEIEKLYLNAWKMGLKAVAIYRDNCKVSQPLSMAKKDSHSTDEVTDNKLDDKIVLKGAVKRQLPRVRKSQTYKFTISDLKGYFTVSEYDDGKPGELFINVSKQGSTLSGLMDSLAISISHGLQYGVPLKSYVKTLRGTSFPPSGITNDPDIPTTTSIVDYIIRRLSLDYLSYDDQLELGLVDFLPDHSDQQLTIAHSQDNEDKLLNTTKEDTTKESHNAGHDLVVKESKNKDIATDVNAPLCFNCGNQTQRSGSCYVCLSCGSTTGCS